MRLAATGFDSLRQLTPAAHRAFAVVLFALIAVFDALVDPDLSLYALYFIPAVYTVWFLGKAWGYAVCALCAGMWLGDDYIQTELHAPVFASVWNLLSRAVVLTAVVTIVGQLKSSLERIHALQRREKELGVAREVQLRLLPPNPPSYRGLDIGFYYKPAAEVGGDYYDFIPLSPTRLAIAVGDVAGKGLPAALLMASLQGLLRNILSTDGELEAFVATLNNSLYRITASHHYATLFLGVVDTAERTIEYVNAGHNPPLLLRGSATGVSIEALEEGGPPVGIFPASRYRSSRLKIEEGWVLAVYTDGVTEAQDALEQEFGEERLRTGLSESISLAAAQITANTSHRLHRFTGDSPQSDDVTLVVVKVLAAGQAGSAAAQAIGNQPPNQTSQE